MLRRHYLALLGLAMGPGAGVSVALAATAGGESHGTLTDGTPTPAIRLTAANGVSARVLAFGATLQSLVLPDRAGKPAGVVLGHDVSADYQSLQDYFGVTVGRYANRIVRGTFVLDGQIVRVPLNDGANSLHGGGHGFDRQLWQVGQVMTTGPVASVELTLVSPDGDSGYPGEVRASVTYTMSDAGELTITMQATTTRPTIINMTNHALFNMAGQCVAQGTMAQRLTIPASRYTPINATLIPTGELAPVAGTPFDFRSGRVLADGLRAGNDPQIRIGRGYDHTWVLDKGQTAEPALVDRVEDPRLGPDDGSALHRAGAADVYRQLPERRQCRQGRLPIPDG